MENSVCQKDGNSVPWGSVSKLILPADESPDSLERAKPTCYSLHDLVGKVNLVFLHGAAHGWSWYDRGNTSPGFPVSHLVNVKFMSKDNILPAHQWLKATWLSLGACFTKTRVTLKEGAALGTATAAFLGALEAHALVCRGLGEKSQRSGAALASSTGKSFGQTPKSLRAMQEPRIRRASYRKNAVNNHGGTQGTCTAETPI